MSPSAIVLHATVGEALPSLNWLANPNPSGNPDLRVSIHYLIDRDGTTYQMVEEVWRAWHAGESNYLGLQDWNNFSIGVEMVNRNDGVDPYDPRLVEAARQLCIHLVEKYDIQPSLIVSHQQISLRGKTDPKNFPLADFIASLYYRPELLRLAAWTALGVELHPEFAFQRRAQELQLGAPVGSELRTVIGGVRWAFQCFSGGVLATEEGNWGDIRLMNW